MEKEDNWLADQSVESVKNKSGRTFIYFIGPEGGPIKIGKAKNVQKRLIGIQVGSPYKLQLHGVCIGPERLETALHARFSEYRMSGEWFERSKEIETFIEENTIASDVAYFKNIEQIPLIEDMRVKLAAKSKSLEASARDHVFKKFTPQMKDQLVDFWGGQLTVMRNILRVYRNLQEELRKHDRYITSDYHFFDKLRTTLREALEIDWRDAQHLLNLEEDYERDDAILQDHAQKWLDSNWHRFDLSEQPRKVLWVNNGKRKTAR